MGKFLKLVWLQMLSIVSLIFAAGGAYTSFINRVEAVEAKTDDNVRAQSRYHIEYQNRFDGLDRKIDTVDQKTSEMFRFLVNWKQQERNK